MRIDNKIRQSNKKIPYILLAKGGDGCAEIGVIKVPVNASANIIWGTTEFIYGEATSTWTLDTEGTALILVEHN